MTSERGRPARIFISERDRRRLRCVEADAGGPPALRRDRFRIANISSIRTRINFPLFAPVIRLAFRCGFAESRAQ